MTEPIPFEEIGYLFEEFEHTAWRLETRRGYASDRVSPRWEAFQRGEKLEYDPGNPWHANVRRQTEQGKRFERVRLVDEPPTEGQRFLLASGLSNVEAGEDIRNMYRAEAHRLGLPECDFWLFDSRTVVKFVFDDQEETLGVHLLEDAATVARACQVRDRAWHYAIATVGFGGERVAAPREPLADFGPKEVGRTPSLIDFDEFDAMFETFEHTAWRLETRRAYRSDEETETYRRFMRGEDAGYDLDDPWCASRREQTALGKRFERVRIVDDPPTPGQLYLLDGARRNSAVGEDIRNLRRNEAERLRLPAEDFWIFDSRVVALLHFDDADRITEIELITDPVEVVRYCQARDAAWHHAVARAEFEERTRST